jgi:3-oxoacyl-[acyl-carrier protein] reductase
MAEGSLPPSILISGTSRGIGRYLAEYYVSRGSRVYGCSRGQATWELDGYRHFTADVSDERAVKTMFAEIRKAGGLDVLINNAAVNPAIAPAMLLSTAGLMKTIETNIVGTFLLAREAAKLMAQRRFGRIINMSSMAVRHNVGGEAAYTLSKAAVTAFSQVFAKEIYGHGITCNVVAPAAIPTELSAAVDAGALQLILARNAIPAMGEMSDVSNTIDWLIRRESHAVTGQVIYLGGV